jgi:hypothetical protein
MMLTSKPALDDLLGALIVLLEPAAEAQARRAP